MSRKLLLVALAGCAVVGPVAGSSDHEPHEGGKETSTPANSAGVRPSLVVHEWGTFTSVQSSVGQTLEGLHHEEERLPAFVYGRNGGAAPQSQSLADAGANKGMETGAELHGVTQKLETPVIYFYSDEPVHATVDVKFPGGILSEWYPNARSFAPELGQWERIADGRMQWDFDITPGKTDGFPEVSPEDVWAPSRRVAATPIAVGNEREKFIFYRGLGAFEGPFRSKATGGGRFSFTNESDESISAAFLLRVHEAGGAIVPLGAIAGHGTVKDVPLPTEGKEGNLDAYVDTAKHVIKEALVASGLFDDESQAMVDTWSRSYFKTPGTRVLYVVPRSWTDRLLPLTIAPAPGRLVRTLVGRVEVLSQSDENAVVASVESYRASSASPEALVAKLGRFAEPKLRRACALVSPASASYCSNAVSFAAR